MSVYYNEMDKFAAAWLRELIAEGLIPEGDVDERSIEDVKPYDLRPYAQHHFFAGIGIWPLALRCAGWSDSREIWTGSCPCQPFSAAGKGGGFADERHLWPAFDWLIRQRLPRVVLGEQVASKDGLAWLDLVQSQMEDAGYAFGAVDLCAAGFGSPHIRQRSFWVADAAFEQRDRAGRRGQGRRPEHPDGSTSRRMADDDEGLEGRQALPERTAQRAAGPGGLALGLGNGQGIGRVGWPDDRDEGRRECASGQAGAFCGLGNAERWRSQSRNIFKNESTSGLVPPSSAGSPGPTNGLWRAADWLGCTDGKWRPVEPGTFPLAHAGAFRNRVGLLRGAGNSINLAVAQGFIAEVMSYLDGKELLDD